MLGSFLTELYRRGSAIVLFSVQACPDLLLLLLLARPEVLTLAPPFPPERAAPPVFQEDARLTFFSSSPTSSIDSALNPPSPPVTLVPSMLGSGASPLRGARYSESEAPS